MNLSYRLLGLLVLCVSALGSLESEAQTVPPREIQVRLAPGVALGLSIDGVNTSAVAPLLVSSAAARDGELYRLVVDDGGHVRFAYAMTAQPTRGGAELSFRPLRLHEVMQAFAPKQAVYDLPFKLDASLVTLRDTQRTGIIRVGDVVRLELFEHARTGGRIADVIRVIDLWPDAVQRLNATHRAAPPKRVALTLSGLRLRRDGVVMSEQRAGTFSTGDVLLLGIPGHGQVAFTAEPDPTIEPTGVAALDGRTLRFTLGGHEFECVSNEPVGPDGLTALWMYASDHPGPPMSKGRVWIGAARSVESWLASTQRREE